MQRSPMLSRASKVKPSPSLNKGGEKKIEVPASVPVVTIVPATKEEIKPGAIVFVPTMRQADESLTGGAVLFGKDGVIPLM
jgi:hypothetical protein